MIKITLQRQFILSTVILLSILCHQPMMAQEWQKSIEKIDLQIETGDYRKAEDQLIKFQEKVVKKLGEPNKFQALGYLRQARNQIGLGLLKNVESVVSTGLETARNSPDITTEEMQANYQDAVDIMILYGNYLTAEKYLQEALSMSDKNDENTAAELEVLRA
ncbi:MAG: hypothetical protein AAFO69_18390, partial [Bacteroidota bacterium]